MVSKKDRMSLFVLGLNHRTAPVEVRERVNFDPALLPGALQDLVSLPAVDEGMIVSTCNRTELYVVGEGSHEVGDWLRETRSLDHQADKSLYTKEHADAIRHAFSVACGLDSMVLGEPQILGQVKDAYRLAGENGAVGPVLNRLFQQAFSVAKQVRSDTGIGASAVSVASASISLAANIFTDFTRHTALFVGAGQTIELAARHLRARGLQRMIFANRSVDRARRLAETLNAFAIPLDGIDDHLAEADMVICSTASPEPILDGAMVKRALKARRRKPMFIVDLAVPRDVATDVRNLHDVYLYTVDDLEEVVRDNMRLREESARSARKIVDNEVVRFERNLKLLDAVPVIREVRSQAEAVSEEVLDHARRQINAGRDPNEVLSWLSDTLTHKLLHAPTTRIRVAGEDGDESLLKASRELFGVTKP
jgi:glutamyl-tRNA reductase